MARLVPEHKIDFVVVNGENMAHGNGILPEMAQEFFDLGVDVITTGNHAWDQRQIIPIMATTTRLIRPANYPDHPAYKTPGRGSTVVESKSQARPEAGRDPGHGPRFHGRARLPVSRGRGEVDRLDGLGIQCILIDFHGEATSEKQAFALLHGWQGQRRGGESLPCPDRR